MVTLLNGTIIIHCGQTIQLFQRSEETLVGMNFLDLMTSYERRFFKVNTFVNHYTLEDSGRRSLLSQKCNSRTIRYCTPHSDDVNINDLNMITSKVVSIPVQLEINFTLESIQNELLKRY